MRASKKNNVVPRVCSSPGGTGVMDVLDRHDSPVIPLARTFCMMRGACVRACVRASTRVSCFGYQGTAVIGGLFTRAKCKTVKT